MKRTERRKREILSLRHDLQHSQLSLRSHQEIYGIFLRFKFFENSKLYAFDYHNNPGWKGWKCFVVALNIIKFEFHIFSKMKISVWDFNNFHKHKKGVFSLLFHSRDAEKLLRSLKTCLCFQISLFFSHQKSDMQLLLGLWLLGDARKI